MVIWTMIAQSADVNFAWADSIIKVTTAAGFGGLTWFFVTRHIPAIEARHAAERERTEVRHANSITELVGAIKSLEAQVHRKHHDD